MKIEGKVGHGTKVIASFCARRLQRGSPGDAGAPAAR